ncbi:MAG: stalk domain-containing protein [Caldisericia bacterium]
MKKINMIIVLLLLVILQFSQPCFSQEFKTDCRSWSAGEFEHYIGSNNGISLFAEFENEMYPFEGDINVMAFISSNGFKIWDSPIVFQNYQFSHIQTILVTQNKLIIFDDKSASSDFRKEASLTCYDLSKNILWQIKYPGTDHKPQKVQLVGEKLYVVTEKPELLILDINSGKIESEIDVSEYDSYFGNYTVMTVLDDFVIIRGSFTSCYQIYDGEIEFLWDTQYLLGEHHVRNRITHFPDPILLDGNLLVCDNDIEISYNTNFYLLDISTGKPIWEREYTPDIYKVIDGRLVVLESTYKNELLLKEISIEDGKETGVLFSCERLNYPHFVEDSNKFLITGYNEDQNEFIVHEIEKDFSESKTSTIKEQPSEIFTFFDYLHSYYEGRIIISGNVIPLISCSASLITLNYKIDSTKMRYNGVLIPIMDVSPVIQNGRTLLPARFVTEPLGGSVAWDGYEKKVVCTLADKTVELWINKPTTKISGQEVQIDPDNPDVVPTIINDRTMVPMRFLAESLGCEVEWIAETKTVIITYHER